MKKEILTLIVYFLTSMYLSCAIQPTSTLIKHSQLLPSNSQKPPSSCEFSTPLPKNQTPFHIKCRSLTFLFLYYLIIVDFLNNNFEHLSKHIKKLFFPNILETTNHPTITILPPPPTSTSRLVT